MRNRLWLRQSSIPAYVIYFFAYRAILLALHQWDPAVVMHAVVTIFHVFQATFQLSGPSQLLFNIET